MQKGVMRIEPNVSLRPLGIEKLGTRVEIKNLNSFRALERSIAFEIQRQRQVLEEGGRIQQVTLGWDVESETTFIQRTKEEEDDYRYFPEPDLPPLVIEQTWIDQVREALPELPTARLHRFESQYGLSSYDAGVLVAEQAVADYFEQTVFTAGELSPKLVSNWISGELFSLLNQSGLEIGACPITPEALAGLLRAITAGIINSNTAKSVLAEMFSTAEPSEAIIAAQHLQQISDGNTLAGLVSQVLAENPAQVTSYLQGKDSVARWLFGQVMHLAKGQANPQLLQAELDRQLSRLKSGH
jgi:aspartyl-tRNA(Asn)/glutamyl-tRNA(Gln) amidotransferase subunit B